MHVYVSVKSAELTSNGVRGVRGVGCWRGACSTVVREQCRSGHGAMNCIPV